MSMDSRKVQFVHKERDKYIYLRNISRTNISTNFRGHIIEVKPKQLLVLDRHNEEHKALSTYLTHTFGFVIDVSSKQI